MKLLQLSKAKAPLLLVLILCMCQQENVQVQNKPTINKTDIASIGTNHNKGLDYIYNYLKSNGGSKMSTAQLLRANKAASFEFLDKTYSNLNHTDRKKIKDQVEANFSYLFNSDMVGRVNSETIQGSLAEIAPYTTANQRQYINNIFQSLETLESNMVALQFSFNAIEAQAYNLPAEEGAMVLSAVSVARNSAYYWQDNMDLWNEVLDPTGTNHKTMGQISWGGVAKGDVAGAVVMAVSNAWFSLGGPLGWGYWVTSVGLAALVTSGAVALIYLKSASTTVTAGIMINQTLRI